MTHQEIFVTYGLPVIAAALTAFAGFIGTQVKKLYEKYINDKTKEAVVRTCVKAAEQLYHDLGGPEKLKKAQEGAVEMLNEKGIPISELELNLLIESVVSEFNYGFAKASEAAAEMPAAPADGESAACAEPEEGYSEEGGGR